MMQEERIRAVADTARVWRAPEFPARAAGVEATLAAPNRFTEEGLAFALNHRMHQATPEALRAWTDGLEVQHPVNVGVVCGDDDPLAGWEAVLGAYLLGHRVAVGLSSASPAIMPAFFNGVMDRGEAGGIRFVPQHQVAQQVDSVITYQGKRGSVAAVIDGQEDAAALSGLAEDVLLHEGIGPDTPAVVWAPRGLDPDALLNALAGFREFYPPHPDTDGTLALPTAFFASAKQSHATGPGFLVSKGAPEPQGPGHLRWAEYDSLAEVNAWILARPGLSFVVATPEVAERVATDVPIVAPGDAHRPSLGERNPGLIEFLAGL